MELTQVQDRVLASGRPRRELSRRTIPPRVLEKRGDGSHLPARPRTVNRADGTRPFFSADAWYERRTRCATHLSTLATHGQLRRLWISPDANLTYRSCVAGMMLACWIALGHVASAADAAAKVLAGPLQQVEEIVFAVRLGYDDPHWYANIGYYCDDENQKAYAGNGKPDAGRLCKLNVRSGEVTVLLDAQGGSIRDPEVHYDAQKVLFSYRKADTDFYHLYEINLDGTGLRQITSGSFDDYEPAYLPDGGIVFVSTRCQLLGQLLEDAGRRALPLRCGWRQPAAAVSQSGTRQHALPCCPMVASSTRDGSTSIAARWSSIISGR